MVWLGGLALLILTQATDPAAIEDDLRRARNEYAYGNYDAAIDKLHALLYPMRLSTDEQVIEARQYLALSYYLTDHLPQAKEELAKLLFLNPDYELDPFSVAPPVVELFESLRRDLKTELDQIRRQRFEQKRSQKDMAGILRTVELRTKERSDVASFLPFGVGQFQNGDTGWGVFFAAAEAALIAANIGAYLTALSMNHYDASQAGTVQALQVAQYSSLALFGVTWSIGAFQARVNFSPTVNEPPVIHEGPLSELGVPKTFGLSLGLNLN